jgi:hypothetical protein
MASRRIGQSVNSLLFSQRSPRSKFGSKQVVVDDAGRFWSREQAQKLQIIGERCDSQLEARHLVALRDRLRRGEITNLRHPHRFVLSVNGQKIGEIWPDFSFVDVATGKLVVHDCKGRNDPSRDVEYRFFLWKCKHLLAEHGVAVVEIRDADTSARAEWARRLDSRR